MSKPSSWRELLRNIISNPSERDRIANEMGIHSVTLTRWSNSESKPRPQNLRQLLRSLHQPQRDLFIELLEAEYAAPLAELLVDESSDEIEYRFIRQILDARATTTDHLLFWTICRNVLQHALRRLDSEQVGVAVRVAQCMPPSDDGKVHSLRERMGLGTPPWPEDLEPQAIFLGAESLAGQAVTLCRSQIMEDVRNYSEFAYGNHAEYEVSAAAYPIMYTNHVAGCLLFSSTQPGYFSSPTRQALIHDYAQLISLALTPDQFYSAKQIALWVMPPREVQRAHFATFQQRVISLMKETFDASRPLDRIQAELIVWQQIEEEFIHPSPQPTLSKSDRA